MSYEASPPQRDWLPEYRHAGDWHLPTDGMNPSHLERDSYVHFIRTLLQVERFVLEVISTSLPAFKLVERTTRRNDLVRINKDTHKYALAKYFQLIGDWASEFRPDYQYSTYVNLFLNQYMALELGRENFRDPLGYTSREGVLAYERYNEFIESIRAEAASLGFRQIIYRRKAKSVSNLKEGEKYIDCLFHNHSRLMVLRVDFTYLSAYAPWVSAEIARRDFDHFLNNLNHNRHLNKHKVGYIWKMEFGPHRGFHFHLLFFYNDAHVTGDAYWAEKLTAYWKQCTNRLVEVKIGHEWNCNKWTEKTKHEQRGTLGVGVIHRHDAKLRHNLVHHVLKYMCKPEQFLIATKLDEYGRKKTRIFGKGECTRKGGIRKTHRMDMRASKSRP